MTTDTGSPSPFAALDLREQIARIDLLQADLQRRQQEVHLVPWQIFFTVLGGGAAFFAAGAAVVKLLMG
jgi:hypothetical protein